MERTHGSMELTGTLDSLADIRINPKELKVFGKRFHFFGKKATLLNILNHNGIQEAVLHSKIPRYDAEHLIGALVSYRQDREEYEKGTFKEMLHDYLFVIDGPLTDKQYSGSLLVHNDES